ncbi:MAG TPA: sortase [Patescibacteria group bacterium]|nr:sortase [Patescibacteria group bacterium]
MNKKTFVRILILRTIGNFLILFTIFAFFATFGPTLYYEASYQIAKAKGIKYVLADDVKQSNESELGKLVKKYDTSGQVQNQGPSLLGDVLSKSDEKVLVPPSSDFSVVIPKIGAAESITPNVDPSNKDEYLRVLQHSIAHAKGTAYPGVNGTTYLFAHSADSFWDVGRYNAVFYLLKDLQPGDDVYLFFHGKRYNYKVYDKKIVDSNDVSYIDAALGQGERVILQTCWPPGTDWKRTLIFAKPVES